MASMPLLWLWFPKHQRRQASSMARALGKGDIMLEASATGVLGKEKTGQVLGVPELLREVEGAELGSGHYPSLLQVGLARVSHQTSLV